jgi:hypothetical protein
MEKTDEREPEMAVMKIKGQGVGAMMNMETKFQLADVGEGTKMHWAADVKLAGPVASMGQRVLQPIVNQQVQHVLGALDKRVQESLAAGGGAGQPEQGQGPKDYGPPADADADPQPDTGASGAEEGISPISDEPYENEQ